MTGLELAGITKRFPGGLANDEVNLKVAEGEIVALLGENGAGKTTLMNILYGLYSPTSGKVLVDGEERRFHGPGDAIAAGIGMVHQHFMLVPVFTVTENVILGDEPTRRLGWLAPQRGRKGGPRLPEPLPPQRRSRRPRREPSGRHPAAGGDHQGPGAGGAVSGIRRTHLGSPPGGGRP